MRIVPTISICLGVVGLDSYFLLQRLPFSTFLNIGFLASLLFGILTLNERRYKRKIIFSWTLTVLVLTISLFALVNVAVSLSFRNSLPIFASLAIFFSQLSAFNAAKDYEESLTNVLSALCMSSLLALLLSLIIYGLSPDILLSAHNTRFGGIYLNPNNTGAISVYAICIIDILSKRCQSYPRLLKSKLILILLYAIALLSFSIMAALMLLSYYIAKALVFKPSISLRTTLLCAILCIGLYVLITSSYELPETLLPNRLLARISALSDNRGSGRLDIYLTGLHLHQEIPFLNIVFGVGHGGFNLLVGNSAHNTFLRILLDYGYIGIIAVLGFSFSTIAKAITLNHRLRRIYLLSPPIIVNALVYDPFASPSNMCFVLILLSLITSPLFCRFTR